MRDFDANTMQAELRQQIRKNIADLGWMEKELAEKADMKPPALSKILTGRQLISLSQLDAITKALGLSEGELYPYYLGECYNVGNRKININKAIAFIIRCYMLGKAELADFLLGELVSESNRHAKFLFTVAEELFQSGHVQVAKPIYRHVTWAATDVLEDHYSLSYLRYFQIVRSNVKEAFEPSYDLERSVELLPSREWKMEAYTLLTKYSYVTGNWTRLERIADALIRIARGYHADSYGHGLLSKGAGLHGQGKIDDALATTYQYEAISERYAKLAKGNRLIYLVDRGEVAYIPDLIVYAKQAGTVESTFKPVMQGYLRRNMLDECGAFLADISEYLKAEVDYDNPITMTHYMHFHYLRSVYDFYIGQVQQVADDIVRALQLADQLFDYRGMRMCLSFLYRYALVMTDEQREQIQAYLGRGDLYEEQIYDGVAYVSCYDFHD